MNHTLVALAGREHLQLIETLPSHLSGASGANRAQERAQLKANDDRSAVLAWLARYQDAPSTFASYRREAERLLLWSVFQQGKAMSDLAHEDFLLYENFLSDPQPASRWVMSIAQKPSRSSPHWRPFAKPLDTESRRQALSILNSLFNWLVQAGYLSGNPLALRRRKSSGLKPKNNRFLPYEHWAEIRKTIELLPIDSPRHLKQSARYRWLFTLLYIGGLRISEVCNNKMGDFYWRRSLDGTERWWLSIDGKGGKSRSIPATEEMLSELMRYRKANGLVPLPYPKEDMPLLLPLIGLPKPMARSAIHELVKYIFNETASRLRADESKIELASYIEKASAHWIRHTAATHQSDRIDLKLVRDNLGHANIATTNIYLHSEDDSRHDLTSNSHKIGWAN